MAPVARSESIALAPVAQFTRYQLLPSLGTVAIARVTKAIVMKLRDGLLVKYAASRANSALGCLSAAMSYCVDRGWIASNPCHGVRLVEVHERAYNWIKTRGELERLLGVCPDEEPATRALCPWMGSVRSNRSGASSKPAARPSWCGSIIRAPSQRYAGRLKR